MMAKPEKNAEKMTGTSVNVSIYLGSNEDGIGKKREIIERASRRGMGRSEYLLFCFEEQIKREREAEGHGTKDVH